MFQMFIDWNKIEFRRLRAAMIWGAMTPLSIIVVGVAVGRFNWYAKFVVVEIAIAFATFSLVALVVSLAALTAEVSVGISAATRGSRPVAEVAEEYVRFVAGFITSVIVVGMGLVWPDYTTFPLLKLLMTWLMMTSVIAVVTWVIWQGGGKWWPRVTWWAIVANLILPLVALSMPRAFEVVTNLPAHIERKIVCADNPKASGCPPLTSAATLPKIFTWVKVAEVDAPEKWGPEFLAPISISGIFRWVAKEGEAEVRCSNGFYIVLGANIQRDESGQAASGMCRARSSDKPTKVSVYTPQT